MELIQVHRIWASAAVLISIVAAALVLGGCHEVEETNRTAMKAGLVQKNDHVGTTHWDKP